MWSSKKIAIAKHLREAERISFFHCFTLNRRSIYLCLNAKSIVREFVLIFAINIPDTSFRRRDNKKHESGRILLVSENLTKITVLRILCKNLLIIHEVLFLCFAFIVSKNIHKLPYITYSPILNPDTGHKRCALFYIFMKH